MTKPQTRTVPRRSTRKSKAWIFAVMGLIATPATWAGCPDNAAPGKDASTDSATADAAWDGKTDANQVDGGLLDSAIPDVAPKDAGITDAAPVSSCTDIAAASCFSNLDCPDDTTRCENVGSQQEPVACCVSGPRGTRQAGEPCSNENDCASAVCIEHNGLQLCSTDCNGPQDCPDGMKDCIFIAFSGSDDKWCFPQ